MLFVCFFFPPLKEKLKAFEERLVEERKKRLEDRRKQRKEERRNTYYRQKEEEEQRIREEQLKKGNLHMSGGTRPSQVPIEVGGSPNCSTKGRVAAGFWWDQKPAPARSIDWSEYSGGWLGKRCALD